MLGKKGPSDTIWASALAFPDTLLPLDTIPVPPYSFSKPISGDPRGLNVTIDYTGGVCAYNHSTWIDGYNNVVYFKYNRGAGDRFGKVMIYGYQLDTCPTIDGRPIGDLEIAFTLSDAKDLNSGSVVALKPPSRGSAYFSTSPAASFDLNGRLVAPQLRAQPHIPLLSDPSVRP